MQLSKLLQAESALTHSNFRFSAARLYTIDLFVFLNQFNCMGEAAM
jgi:hypothetical protein